MLPVSRHSLRQTDTADLSGAQRTSTEEHSAPAKNATAEKSNTPASHTLAPGLPQTLHVGGEEYYSGALKGRFNSEQIAYLISAGTPDQNKPVTHHPDGSKEYGFSHNGDKNCTALLHADDEKSLTSLTLKDGRGKEVVSASYDKNLPANAIPDRLNFDIPTVSIPSGAIFNGHLPSHPDGERYQAMPFKTPGSKAPLMVTGLRHPGSNLFTVYDTTSHKPVTQLTIVTSTGSNGAKDKLLVSPEQLRMQGGMRHFLPTAEGVKTSKTSPTGFKRKSDNQPCDRHGNLLPAASSSQAATSTTAAGSSRMTVENIIAKGADPADRTEPTGFKSIEELRQYVNDNPVPQLVFRAHDADADEIENSGLERNLLAGKKEGDDYLADIIRHTATTGGSGGNVLSLSGESLVANRFLHSGRSLVQIDTQQLPGRFKSAAQILLEDGDRLIGSGKVSSTLVRKALENLLSEGEKEIFCLDGDIPPQAVTVLR